jgi:hypothetical protein
MPGFFKQSIKKILARRPETLALEKELARVLVIENSVTRLRTLRDIGRRTERLYQELSRKQNKKAFKLILGAMVISATTTTIPLLGVVGLLGLAYWDLKKNEFYGRDLAALSRVRQKAEKTAFWIAYKVKPGEAGAAAALAEYPFLRDKFDKMAERQKKQAGRQEKIKLLFGLKKKKP